MTRTLVISFLLGLVVAAVLYETTGMRILGSRASQVASSGPTPAASPRESPSRSARPMPSPMPAAPRLSGTSDPGESGKVQTELSDAQARANFAEHQLEAVEGRQIPWPENVAPVFKRESVEQQIKQFVVDRGLGKLKSIDCAEYPCVEVVQLTDGSPEGTQALRTALNEMVKEFYHSKVVLSVLNSRAENGSNVSSFAGISIAPNDADTKGRARYRSRLGLEEYTQ